MIKTIDIPGALSFSDALSAMFEGKCVGIRPSGNTSFIVLYRPHWMSDPSDGLLRWKGTTEGDIRASQFLETWNLVVVDHREIKESVDDYC